MTAFITLLETLSAGKAGHVQAMKNGTLGETLTRIVDAGINAGLGVTHSGATPGKTVKAPSTKAEAKQFAGILLDPEFRNDINSATEYLAGQQADILRVGYVWVTAESTTAVDDDVFVRFTSDGGSNTTLGTFRCDNDTPSGGIVITPSASPVQSQTITYSIRIRNKAGADETFAYASDATATVTEIATGLVAAINGSSNFAATGTTTVTITAVAGSMVEVINLSEHLTVTTPARCERVVGAKFRSAVTGAGLAVVELQIPAQQGRV